MNENVIKNNIANSLATELIDSEVVYDEQYRPKLLVNNLKKGIKILSALQDELKDCDEFAISVAFINWGGIINLLNIFYELEKRNIKGRILTTNYLNFTEPKALERLRKYSNRVEY